MATSAEPPCSWRTFPSVCDVCLRDVRGRVERAGDEVRLVRDCATHGRREFLVSTNGADFERYDRFRRATAPPTAVLAEPPRTFFFVTPACNQGCTYCLNEANGYAYFDVYDIERFAADVARVAGEHVSVVGGEPFSHPRFLELAAIVRGSGKTLQVFTNGLALADERRVIDLLETTGGRCQVFMTFEGFAPELYAHVGVGRAHDRKIAALAHLAKHDVPVVLHQTLPPGTDADRQAAAMRTLIDYALAHEHVRAVAFQAVVAIGGARHLAAADVCSVDRAMDRVLAALPVRVARREVYVLQKLLGLMSGVTGTPRCPHMQVALLVRDGGRWSGLDALVDCARLDRRLDGRLGRRPFTRGRMLWTLAVDGAAAVRWRHWRRLLRLARRVAPAVRRGFDVGRLPRDVLPIVASTVCDRFNYDATLARRCDKVVYSNVRGRVIRELASRMSLRQSRERAENEDHGTVRERRAPLPIDL